jgi:LAGLIDADG endonuclease
MKYLLSANDTSKAYLAGFLDADGCFNAQILKRPDYRLRFQIRVSVTFYQSTKRHWFLLTLFKLLKCGSLRKRKDGISEYSIVGTQQVLVLCEQLLPYLRLKRRQALLIIQICKTLRKTQTTDEFLLLCKLADQIGELNDSKTAAHHILSYSCI